MPVSHLTLTVAHLPTSTSFFLSCLQPLGYQFIGRHDDFIGFGQKSGEPADFWITEQKPGVPAGAAHVAFPAPSKDAVGTFFINALKSGAKLHGEPKTRDADSGYYSAAIIDFDGNSIEAVYRPSHSSARSEISQPTLALLEGGSVVSKASSRASTMKTESIAPRSEAKSYSSKASTAIDRGSPSGASRDMQPSPTYVVHSTTTQKTEEGKTAKTIVGSLIGAAAGAALAYAMTSSTSDSTETATTTSPPPQYSPREFLPQLLSASQAPSQVSERQGYRAIEAGPARSTYSQSEGRPSLARSVSSKNPRASTIYEGTEFIPRSSGGSMYMDNNGRRASEGGSGVGGGGGGSVYMDNNGRRASEGSVYSSDREIPLRAIEYPPPLDESYEEGGYPPYDASTLISSFPDQSRAMMDQGSGGSVYSSASTIKPSKANSHYSERQRSSPPSSHHGSSASSSRRSSHHHQSTHRSPSSHRSTHSHRSRSSEAGSHAPSSTRSARHVPLPDGGSSIASFATYRSGSHAPSSKSYTSARDVPLPESMADLDLYDNDTVVTPDDSISQIDEGGRRPSYSHRSHTSRSGGGGGGGGSGGSRASSKHSSRFDEPVRPADSVSQISVNKSHVSKASSQRTMKAGGTSKAGSKMSTGTASRRGSQVV